jgi:serine/threonine protein kinase
MPGASPGGRLPVDQATWCVYQASLGLAAAGLVHRDVKPANLLLATPSGSGHPTLIPGDLQAGARLIVADWGLVLDPTAERLTKTASAMGSPLYMSPEQCRCTHSATVASDIYALGIVLYEAITGAPPFDGSDPCEILEKQVKDEPPWPDDLPAEVRLILERCLAKNPIDRYADHAQFQAALLPLFFQPTTPSSTAQGSGWIGRILKWKPT